VPGPKIFYAWSWSRSPKFEVFVREAIFAVICKTFAARLTARDEKATPETLPDCLDLVKQNYWLCHWSNTSNF